MALNFRSVTHQVQQTGMDNTGRGLESSSPVGGGVAPSPEKNEIFCEKACFGAFWARCGDCLDVTAYGSGVFMLLQTHFTIEPG